MDINAIGGNGFDPKSMREAMHGKKQDEQPVIEQVAAEAPKARESAAIEQKDYTKARLAGMQAQAAQMNQQNAILNVAMAEAGASNSNAVRTLAGKKAARRIMESMQQKVAEESERNLKENRDSIEERTEQALSGNAQAQVAAPAPAQVAAASAGAAASDPEQTTVATPAPATPAPAAASLDVTV